MDFQLSYFPISICIVFSKNWFVTFGTWTQSSFLWFFLFVCFEKPVIFFCLSSLTFTGRKRIYQQGRKQTQSWQYLHNTLPPPPHFPQARYTFIFVAPTAQLNSVFLESTEEARTQCINTVSTTFKTEPDPVLLWVDGRAPTDLEEARLSLYKAHIASTLDQQCINISWTWLTAFSSCARNSSPRLLGNLLMVWSSLKFR